MVNLFRVQRVDTGISVSEEQWELICKHFDSLEDGTVYLNDAYLEDWAELEQVDQKLHDTLMKLVEEAGGSIHLAEEE